MAFLVTVGVMTYIVREVKIDVTTGGTTVSQAIAAQWLVPIGVLITLLAVGGVLSLFHRAPEATGSAALDEEPGAGPDQLTTTAGRN
ncbi:Sodium:solute symporter OS=Streptomyces tendae OX=1932 GN=GUR47_23525 PE=3 SV=1 [Streptomyces tendae]